MSIKVKRLSLHIEIHVWLKHKYKLLCLKWPKNTLMSLAKKIYNFYRNCLKKVLSCYDDAIPCICHDYFGILEYSYSKIIDKQLKSI